jgi:small Trp-rich protein
MWLVGIGLLMFVLHALDIGPPGRWNLEFFGDLWKFLIPFGLAAAWWAFSDSTGLTQRRAIKKMEAKTAKRRERNMRNLGLETRTRDGKKLPQAPAQKDPTRREEQTPPPPRDPWI